MMRFLAPFLLCFVLLFLDNIIITIDAFFVDGHIIDNNDNNNDNNNNSHNQYIEFNHSRVVTQRRQLSSTNNCDGVHATKQGHQNYFRAMQSIYGPTIESTCLMQHSQCGWPKERSSSTSKLPLFVLSVGLEGAGHHLYSEILGLPVVDCLWINGRHYHREISDGVPRTTPLKLAEGFKEQLNMRASTGKPPCKRIFDAEDSFPTGAIRKSGRIFMRPDLINLEMLHGIVFNVKYLIIARNVTDTALSALRRNFFKDIDSELRTVEHTLSYVEAALRGVPCNRIFVAHYEHVLAEPGTYLEPLSNFLELDNEGKEALQQRLAKQGKVPHRRPHKLTQFAECHGLGETACYNKIVRDFDAFFAARAFMWPTFAGNGFDYKKPV